ncbi:hypothetical protein [Bacillus sp. RC250]|uniref:hypothetical protein n=1 Tax=Bacillus sp. RC250 TaxID=3156287 RepID=UPI0038329256
MFDGLSIETISKLPPAFTAIIATLIGLSIKASIHIINQFVLVKTTKEIDKLYLNKASQVKFKFWNLISSTLSNSFYYLCAAVCYDAFLFDILHINKNINKWFTVGSLIISLILLFILLVLFLSSVHKIKKYSTVLRTLLFLHITSSVIVSAHLITLFILRPWRCGCGVITEMIPYIIITVLFFACIQTTMFNLVRKKKTKQYIINIVTEEKLENLIHGYTIDEDRVMCFIENTNPDEAFYICNFSSKVYLKYTKKSEQNLHINQLPTVNNVEENL